MVNKAQKDLVDGVDWKFSGEMEFVLKNSDPAYVSMVRFIILKLDCISIATFTTT